MYRIFAIQAEPTKRPYQSYVARTMTDARRIAKTESELFAGEQVKIIDMRCNYPAPAEVWQNGKKAR